VSDGRGGKATTASLVGAAESAPLQQGVSDGRGGKATTASLVGAAESAP